MPTEYDLSRAFERIESYLIDSMMRNFKRHRAEEEELGYNWEQWQTKQLEALETYRRNNREKFSTEFAELNNKVGEMLRNTASDAAYKQERRILEAIRKGYKPDRGAAQTQAAFFKLNERKMNALVEATTNDLKKAEFAVLRRSNDAYRKAIFDAQVFMNSGSGTYEQAVDMAVKDMLSAGLQCVEYSNGARHTLEDYADMALRTANKRAALAADGELRKKLGITTVSVTRRHGACGKCAAFVGMVLIDDVWSGGKPTDEDGRYPLLSDAMKAGLLHPRCKDSLDTYIEGISTPPDQEVLPKKAREDLTEIERAEQKEQYGRRMEKMYRRLEKYALDPGNKKLYAGRRSQWSDYAAKWHDNHEKQLAKAVGSGIMILDSSKNIVSGNSDMHYTGLGKINIKPLTDEFGTLQTDEVIITDERIDHIKEHHPQDYGLFESYGKQAVTNPDEILVDSKNPGTVFMIKQLPDTNLNVIVRLALDSDDPNHKNSVMTFYRIRESNLNKLRKKNKTLYKRE